MFVSLAKLEKVCVLPNGNNVNASSTYQSICVHKATFTYNGAELIKSPVSRLKELHDVRAAHQ